MLRGPAVGAFFVDGAAMNADLAKLIELQALDDAIDRARQEVAEAPQLREALEARVAAASGAVSDARDRLAQSQTTRRGIEKELAVAQSRLSKFRDQLMEVKTNKEYQAMQNEIATAERQVRGFEDKVLEYLLEADELTAAAKAAEAELQAVQASVGEERAGLDQRLAHLQRMIEKTSADRAALSAGIGSEALALFEYVGRRRAPAMAEARDGHCSVCHVRLRPQVFNDVRRSEQLIQCESCQRILYALAPSARGGAQPGELPS
jgi:uncharacterized protein